jgi:hypothetical protein
MQHTCKCAYTSLATCSVAPPYLSQIVLRRKKW